MRISEQPGRYLAVFGISPAMIFMGFLIVHRPDTRHVVARCLITFGVVFALYESLWLTGVLTHRHLFTSRTAAVLLPDRPSVWSSGNAPSWRCVYARDT